jgi:hypothetical protein
MDGERGVYYSHALAVCSATTAVRGEALDGADYCA